MRIIIHCSHGVPKNNKQLKKKLSPRQLHYVSTFHRRRVDGKCYTNPELVNQMTEKAEENMNIWCEKFRETGDICDLEQCILWGNTFIRYGKYVTDDFDELEY